VILGTGVRIVQNGLHQVMMKQPFREDQVTENYATNAEVKNQTEPV
jgi:hypothetical protein